MTKPVLPEIADRAEVLRRLTVAARAGHVGAMRLLLAELRATDAGEQTQSVIDELARKRRP